MDMQPFLDSIAARALDVAKINLIGHVQSLFAGKREHFQSGEVSVFKPVATRIDFMAPGLDQPVMQLICRGADLTDEQAFWDAMEMPPGVDRQGAIALATGLISHHRDLTGKVHVTYEQIEKEPSYIASILKQRTELSIGLVHLARYIDLNAQLFRAMITRSPASADLYYERDSLLENFRARPCDRAFYDAVRREYAEGEHVGLGLDNYYYWFRASEARFALPDGLLPEDGAALKQIAESRLAAVPFDEDWLEKTVDVLCHNWEVHPRHALLAKERLTAVLTDGAAQDETVRQQLPGNAVRERG